MGTAVCPDSSEEEVKVSAPDSGLLCALMVDSHLKFWATRVLPKGMEDSWWPRRVGR